jgi:hypothetical protein
MFIYADILQNSTSGSDPGERIFRVAWILYRQGKGEHTMKTLLTFLICSMFTVSGFAQTTDAIARKHMTNAEFRRFMQVARNDLRPLDADNTQDSVLPVNGYFTTAQARRMLAVVEKDSGKLALARLLYDRVSDPDNFDQLANVFSSGTYRNEFVAWVNKPDKE